jgi:excisionase family DNA binding protein
MEDLLGVKQAASQLGVSPKTISRLVAARQLPVVKIGRRVLFRVGDLETLVERRTVAAVVNGDDDGTSG